MGSQDPTGLSTTLDDFGNSIVTSSTTAEGKKKGIDFENKAAGGNQGYSDEKSTPSPEPNIPKVVIPMPSSFNQFLPMNYSDFISSVMGKANIEMVFDKSSKTITVTILRENASPQIFVYVASSTPSLKNSPDSPRTMDTDQAYYPTSFPNGIYEIKGSAVTHPNNNDFGRTEIKVEATQVVKTYSQGVSGWEVTGETTDRHYQIHGGGYSGDIDHPSLTFSPLGNNNYLDSTFGCIRMRNNDVDKLGELIQMSSSSGGRTTLKVQD